MAGLGIRAGHQHDLFAGLSEENVERVKRQNRKKISVIIGNPPYNANQQNENDNNKNREYARIDQRIKETYIKQSTAQKTKLYDMYARFFRWASDRLHDDGILAFVTNRSFIESRTFDGFRKTVANEFNEIYVMDLGGDVRANPKLSGTKHNVFGIQTGVAISFFVKRKKNSDREIYYSRLPEFETAESKLSYLSKNQMRFITFDKLTPDEADNWINLATNSWSTLIPIADKSSKRTTKTTQKKSLFSLFSLGIVTARDEWVYSETDTDLHSKVPYFIDIYEVNRNAWIAAKTKNEISSFVDRQIKLTEELEDAVIKNKKLSWNPKRLRTTLYRPFVKQRHYHDRLMTHRFYQADQIFPDHESKNVVLCFLSIISSWPLSVLASNELFDYCLLLNRVTAQHSPFPDTATTTKAPASTTSPTGPQTVPVPLREGQKPKRKIGKDDIFHYVYGVLHDPVYRETYAINLKREFPRIPFYPTSGHGRAGARS